MSKRIVVNVGLLETRVAVQERNLLTEIYLERHRHRSIVGSVYKGTVTNVLPGMQAAFVDIGLSKDAFLYAGDYTANLTDAGPAMLAGAEGSIRLDPSSKPAQIDLVGPKNTLRGLYKLEGERLTFLLGPDGKRPTSFEAGDGTFHIFQREEEKK